MFALKHTAVRFLLVAAILMAMIGGEFVAHGSGLPLDTVGVAAACGGNGGGC